MISNLSTVLLTFVLLLSINTQGQESEKNTQPWYNIERSVRYRPDGDGFIIRNGEGRFNRALYGTNTGYRVEAGDRPEFSQYLPDMGGNLKFGIITPKTSKWLIETDTVIARYKPGSMLYTIKDNILGEGRITIILLALAEGEGMIVKVNFDDVPKKVTLFWAFGGVGAVKFSRDGDIGADPESSFDLKPEYCEDNLYTLEEGAFTVHYLPRKIKREIDLGDWRSRATDEKIKTMQTLRGVYPPESKVNLSDANRQASPTECYISNAAEQPMITGTLSINMGETYYFSIYVPNDNRSMSYKELDDQFEAAQISRNNLANRVIVFTPDEYINNLGGALSVAADAIYQEPSYLHGAIAWRMWLNGWRGAYVADALGWHDRAKAHFRGYAQSQVTEPETAPAVPDTFRHLARQKEEMGTSLFSSGYICRNPNGRFQPHHYDMNLVFIDQLLTHFLYTGDTAFIKEMWPVITRHLAWEKRNFDPDDDGLYDAYCCIWASDALQYNGSSVTHSSAHNYRAHKLTARLAEIVGENPAPYREEAEKTRKAINRELWLPEPGRYAEYKDAFGQQKKHPFPGLWTIYHALDSDVPDAFQAYQSTRYIDTEIPHIPIEAEGISGDYYTLATTNWMPYTWSINNVALAEVLDTSLAYWQAGRSEEAYILWKGALMESMYLGSSPGNFEQLSFYDAMRGELYRDFADPIGMAARTLTEGLFGIKPDALKDTLTIQPGFPLDWEHAYLVTPDISFRYKREGNRDVYTLFTYYSHPMNLKFRVKARMDRVKEVLVNEEKATWRVCTNAIGEPVLEVFDDDHSPRIMEIVWEGEEPEKIRPKTPVANSQLFTYIPDKAKLLEIYDPQGIFKDIDLQESQLTSACNNLSGYHTAFVKLQQEDMIWWSPLDIEMVNPVEIFASHNQDSNCISFQIRNNTEASISGKVSINPGISHNKKALEIAPGSVTEMIEGSTEYLMPGSNSVVFEGAGYRSEATVINWAIQGKPNQHYEPVNLAGHFNEKIITIFKNKYLSPRSEYPTLQIPWQGIGNWCYPLITADINDFGIRKLAGDDNIIILPQGIPLGTPSDTNRNNIIFVSQWDNYPDEAIIPLSGKASHAYLMMAGSTNPMQSRFTNGEVVVFYTDGTHDILSLNNPETWWPIEQDYYTDGYAFRIDYPKLIRVHLKTGLITGDFKDYTSIKGFTHYAIDGGAATILDLSLDPDKTLQSLTLRAVANEVVIGLMSLTLVRE